MYTIRDQQLKRLLNNYEVLDLTFDKSKNFKQSAGDVNKVFRVVTQRRSCVSQTVADKTESGA